ncbi:MAG TPA: peptide ABC transporter substrate-binding protein [Candidatus Baltobacteraceae bacterium]|nr:peptide ABC transporter substrate-binding protein [Candidatus Baltobacteraceae bacterium]
MKWLKRIRAAALALIALAAAAGCERTGTTLTSSGRHSWTIPHVLRLADIADPDNLNEYLSTMDLTYFVSSMIYSYLVVADDQGRLIGDLAVQVPSLSNGGISRDGTTYVYHLRHGVRWQDGAPLTSADVRFSWHAVIDPNNNTLHREGYTEIRAIDTPDRYTVVVHLKNRYPPFVSKFFTPLQEGGKPILPEHILAHAAFNQGPFNSAPVGSGPFKFVRWERGRELILAANPLYYRGPPHLQRIELHIIPNDQTILNEVRLHHIDLVATPSVTQYEEYRSLPEVTTQLYPWNSQELMIINNSKPGLSDVIVRRAITQAIDYPALIAKLTHNTGELAHDFIPPTAIGYTRNPAYRYDPAAANRSLDAAGYRRGADGVRTRGNVRLDYTLDSISGSIGLKMMAVQLQQYFAAIGVRIAVKEYAYNDMFTPDGPIYSNQYDFAIYGVTLTWDPDMSFYIGCDAFYPRGENTYRYCNPQVDKYEARGLSTDVPAERAAAYHHAEPLLWTTVPYIPVYERMRIAVRNPDLRNFKVNPSSTPWYNVWQWDI